MKKMLKKIDWKLFIIYACIAVAIAMILTACQASRKNVSVNKSNTDSVAHTIAKMSRANTTDSAVTKTNISSYDKVTDITYEVYYPSPGAEPVFIPKISIKEKGTKSKQQEIHVQKKDTATADIKQDVAVKKQEKIIEKHKEKIGFSWWLILLIVPIFLFVPDIRKRLGLKF